MYIVHQKCIICQQDTGGAACRNPESSRNFLCSRIWKDMVVKILEKLTMKILFTVPGIVAINYTPTVPVLEG